MRFLLDTNVISELRKPPSTASPAVHSWAASYPRSSFFLSTITIMELELGVRLRERRDQEQGKRLRAWLDEQVLTEFAGRILPVTTDIALRAAALQVPDPRPTSDTLIAATALAHNMTLATRNIRDVETTGARLLNPWDGTRS